MKRTLKSDISHTRQRMLYFGSAVPKRCLVLGCSCQGQAEQICVACYMSDTDSSG